MVVFFVVGCWEASFCRVCRGIGVVGGKWVRFLGWKEGVVLT